MDNIMISTNYAQVQLNQTNEPAYIGTIISDFYTSAYNSGYYDGMSNIPYNTVQLVLGDWITISNSLNHKLTIAEVSDINLGYDVGFVHGSSFVTNHSNNCDLTNADIVV
jgi:hypothetical protein